MPIAGFERSNLFSLSGRRRVIRGLKSYPRTELMGSPEIEGKAAKDSGE
jgi:hypothetical protein